MKYFPGWNSGNSLNFALAKLSILKAVQFYMRHKLGQIKHLLAVQLLSEHFTRPHRNSPELPCGQQAIGSTFDQLHVQHEKVLDLDASATDQFLRPHLH
jgi:hypothetical protein